MNNRNVSLIKNSMIFMIGNFSSKVLIFFLLPLYTHYLDPAEYGQVDIYINVLSILYCVVSLQSIEVVYRFIQDAKDEESKTAVITNSFVIAFVGILIYSVGMLVFGLFTHFEYTYIFIVYTACNILAQFCQQCIRGMNRSLLYSITGVLSTLIQIICNIVFIVLCHMGAVSLLWAHALTYFFICIIILFRCNLFKYFHFSAVKWNIIKEQLKYSIPLMPNALCLWGLSSLGRYLLLFFYTTTEVGVLAFATKFSQLLGMVNSIFFMAWQQSLISEFHSKDRDGFASSIFNKFLQLQFCAIAVMLPCIKFLIFTIMGEAYREAWQYIPIFFVGIMFNAYANFVSMGFYGAKKTNTVFLASLLAIAVYWGLGFFGAKYYYIWGVGGAYAVSQIIYYLVMAARVRKYMKITIAIRNIWIPLTVTVLSFLLYYITSSLLLLVLWTVVFAVFACAFNWQLIVQLKAMVLHKRNH